MKRPFSQFLRDYYYKYQSSIDKIFWFAAGFLMGLLS